jgi:hypothetical protein
MGLIYHEVQLAIGWKVDPNKYFDWLEKEGEWNIPKDVYVVMGHNVFEYGQIVIISVIEPKEQFFKKRSNTIIHTSISFDEIINVNSCKYELVQNFASMIQQSYVGDIKVHAVLNQSQ